MLLAYYAAEFKLQYNPKYTDATKQYWENSLVVISADTVLTEAEKTIICTILAVMPSKCTSPERTINETNILIETIKTGNWSDFGVPTVILPNPSEALRAHLIGLLTTYTSSLLQ